MRLIYLKVKHLVLYWLFGIFMDLHNYFDTKSSRMWEVKDRKFQDWLRKWEAQ